MKQLITILLVFITLNSFSQNGYIFDTEIYDSKSVVTHKIKNYTELESIVCELLNKERVKVGLNKVKRDSVVDEVAYHQNYYLSHHGVSLSHEQNIDIENWEEINDLQDRVHHFMGNNYYGGEIAQYWTPYSYYQDSTNTYTEHWKDSTLNSITNHIAKEIVKSWMESPGHKNVILNKDFTFKQIGVSITGYSQRDERYPDRDDWWYKGYVAIVVLTN